MLDVQIDTKALTQGLTNLAASQVPYAMSRALNQTADAVQLAERNALPGHFDLRRASFFNLLIKIDNADRAKKDRLEVVVKVAPPRAGRTAADILSKFETGGEQVSLKGAGKFLPFPSKDIRQGTKVPPALKWSRFAPLAPATRLNVVRHRGGLQGSHRITTREHVTELVGQQDSFLVQRADGTRVLLQRTGKGKGALRRLYVLVPAIRVPERLHFVDTAQPIATRLLPYFFTNELSRIVAEESARGLVRAFGT